MNKVATYLNEHLTGEVVTHDGALADAQRDGSVLARQPELIARVADTSDVRKVLRFCLAGGEGPCLTGVCAWMRHGQYGRGDWARHRHRHVSAYA